MKIYIDNVNINSTSGPNSFGSRLLSELTNQQCDVTLNTDGVYDICLSFIESFNSINGNAKLIQRLDGIWFKPEDFKTKNENIKKTYYKANGLIFQSNFDKQMIEKHFGERNVPKQVIHNGTVIDSSLSTIGWLEKIKHESDKMFVASSQWRNRPHKRFRDAIRLVSEYSVWASEKCCLITMGDTAYAAPNGKYQYNKNFTHYHLGNVAKTETIAPYRYADWMIHLAYLDHCPNVVVDALSNNVPVICSSEGGTKEIVKKRGFVIEEEKYNFELCDYTAPPRMSFTENHFKKINQGIKIISSDIQDLNIEHVTRQYIEFFNKVLLS